MAKFERVEDKWKDLRKDLYGNVEPEVALEAITVPASLRPSKDTGKMGLWLKGHVSNVERLPALAAGVSYGTKDKLESDLDKAIQLNKRLIKMGHHTPLESIQINFHLSGISKACGAQISRHRVGQGHVSASRRFKEATPQFVYPVLDYISEEEHVKQALKMIQSVYRDSYEEYIHLTSDSMLLWTMGMGSDKDGELEEFLGPSKIPLTPLKKEDRRLVLPISYATERSWWINVRALRDFFRLRLAADSEWEIRRIAWMMYDLVSELLPSLFKDLTDESKDNNRNVGVGNFYDGMRNLLLRP